jgi:uncharacterized protein YggE
MRRVQAQVVARCRRDHGGSRLAIPQTPQSRGTAARRPRSEVQIMRKLLTVLVVAAAFAQSPGARAETLQIEARERLLTVAGQGVVRARPDMALITLGVVSEAKSASDALTANSRSMDAILTALKGAGMESRDLQTSGFSVEPVYSQPPPNYAQSEPFVPEIVGYRVMNNVTLRIRDLARVGALLDQVVTLGANSISGPTFTLANPTPLEDQARRAAIRDAIRKAELYAEAADVELGPIARIEEGYVQPPQPFAGVAARMDAAETSVPIEGGELSIQAQVSVAWRLED